jgi:hypothetical protein
MESQSARSFASSKKAAPIPPELPADAISAVIKHTLVRLIDSSKLDEILGEDGEEQNNPCLLAAAAVMAAIFSLVSPFLIF